MNFSHLLFGLNFLISTVFASNYFSNSDTPSPSLTIEQVIEATDKLTSVDHEDVTNGLKMLKEMTELDLFYKLYRNTTSDSEYFPILKIILKCHDEEITEEVKRHFAQFERERRFNFSATIEGIEPNFENDSNDLIWQKMYISFFNRLHELFIGYPILMNEHLKALNKDIKRYSDGIETLTSNREEIKAEDLKDIWETTIGIKPLAKKETQQESESSSIKDFTTTETDELSNRMKSLLDDCAKTAQEISENLDKIEFFVVKQLVDNPESDKAAKVAKNIRKISNITEKLTSNDRIEAIRGRIKLKRFHNKDLFYYTYKNGEIPLMKILDECKHDYVRDRLVFYLEKYQNNRIENFLRLHQLPKIDPDFVNDNLYILKQKISLILHKNLHDLIIAKGCDEKINILQSFIDVSNDIYVGLSDDEQFIFLFTSWGFIEYDFLVVDIEHGIISVDENVHVPDREEFKNQLSSECTRLIAIRKYKSESEAGGSVEEKQNIDQEGDKHKKDDDLVTGDIKDENTFKLSIWRIFGNDEDELNNRNYSNDEQHDLDNTHTDPDTNDNTHTDPYTNDNTHADPHNYDNTHTDPDTNDTSHSGPGTTDTSHSGPGTTDNGIPITNTTGGVTDDNHFEDGEGDEIESVTSENAPVDSTRDTVSNSSVEETTHLNNSSNLAGDNSEISLSEPSNIAMGTFGFPHGSPSDSPTATASEIPTDTTTLILSDPTQEIPIEANTEISVQSDDTTVIPDLTTVTSPSPVPVPVPEITNDDLDLNDSDTAGDNGTEDTEQQPINITPISSNLLDDESSSEEEEEEEPEDEEERELEEREDECSTSSCSNSSTSTSSSSTSTNNSSSSSTNSSSSSSGSSDEVRIQDLGLTNDQPPKMVYPDTGKSKTYGINTVGGDLKNNNNDTETEVSSSDEEEEESESEESEDDEEESDSTSNANNETEIKPVKPKIKIDTVKPITPDTNNNKEDNCTIKDDPAKTTNTKPEVVAEVNTKTGNNSAMNAKKLNDINESDGVSAIKMNSATADKVDIDMDNTVGVIIYTNLVIFSALLGGMSWMVYSHWAILNGTSTIPDKYKYLQDI